VERLSALPEIPELRRNCRHEAFTGCVHGRKALPVSEKY
jgi:hypothetical protein